MSTTDVGTADRVPPARELRMGRAGLWGALSGLCTAVAVGVITGRWGAALSPDSTVYISAARSLARGNGAFTFLGAEARPPLFPALLAVVAVVSGRDPAAVAPVVNAVLFGLLIWLAALLSSSYLARRELRAAALLAVVFSPPLVEAATWVWTEPLFLCFSVLSLLLARDYEERPSGARAAILGAAVAGACLTRFAGVTLVGCGALAVGKPGPSARQRAAHVSLFLVVASLPLAAWLWRNEVVAGSLFGFAPPSSTSLAGNTTLAADVLGHWLLPGLGSGLAAVATAVALLSVAATLAGMSRTLRAAAEGLRAAWLPAVFTLVYVAFLIVTSSIKAYDPLDDRLLSPIWVPSAVVTLVVVERLLDAAGARGRVLAGVVVVGVLGWLVQPVEAIAREAAAQYRHGRGFENDVWKSSATLAYVRSERPCGSAAMYSNDIYGLYAQTALAARQSPFRRHYQSAATAADLPGLEGRWPPEGTACLVWLDGRPGSFFTVPELGEISSVSLVAMLADGAIYRVERRGVP